MKVDHFRLVGEAVSAEPYAYRSCGLDGIYLLNGYTIESHDGERHVAIKDIDGLHRAIGIHLVKHRKALAPKEVRFLRNTMGFTQAELGTVLGKNSQSVARWEKGQCAMPAPEEKLLRAIFLASLTSERELGCLRKFLINTLRELDDMDQLEAPDAQFQLFDEWKEKKVA